MDLFYTICAGCSIASDCTGCGLADSGVVPICDAPLDHTSAIGVGNTLESLSIQWGYWRATNESDVILQCYNTDACKGGETGADDFCASGYSGPYCAVCEKDYAPSAGHTCTRCSRWRQQVLVAITIVVAAVAIIVLAAIFEQLISTEEDARCSFHRRIVQAIPGEALKIIIVTWQIVTQFADAASVTYPGVYQDFLDAINVVNFDLGSMLAAGCMWSSIDFHDRLLLSTMGPLVCCLFLVITYRIAMLRHSDHAAVERIRHNHQRALLLLTFVVYSSVSSVVFQTFACETLDDGIEYLRADYRIHCTNAKHKAFQVYAGIMVLFYPVGIPLLYAVLLFQNRNLLAHDSADKTAAQPIAGLWEAYRPERFYYEVVECGRRIMLTGVVVFIFPNDAAQLAITMLLAFFFSLVFEVLSPYKSDLDVWLSRGGHVILFLSMFDSLLLRVDVSDERDQSQSALATVLVIGHVLMILAIVVVVVRVWFGFSEK